MAGGESVVVWLEAYLARKGMFRRGGQEDEIRAAACEALGYAGGRKARRLLEEHADDRSPEVRKAAQAALERLHGTDDLREAA
jgi:HEAT repeat protein